MEKRIISILLTITILFAIFPLSVSAEDSNNVVEYSLEDMEYISNKYFSVYKGIEQDICNSENVAYWKMTKKYQENGFWNWALNTASGIVGEKPDKKRCAEILINLMTLQEGELANQIENQSRFDDLKNVGDYVFDVVGIATSFFGASGNDTADTVSAVIETVFDAGKLSVVENKEQAKYYQASIQDYSRMDYFLNSVERYAKIEELREAASELRKVNKNLLTERLEYIGDVAGSIGKFEGTFFMKNMFYELIKDTDTYKTDEATKWFADGAEQATKAILSIGGFAYKITMLAGDIGFGTTDTFNRYQEMKVAADIAQSLTQSIQKIEVKNSNDMETIGKIQSKCDYYDLLLTVHSRGEYLMYKLLMEDAGLCSQFRALFDLFKEPDETTEAWYMRQINAIENYAKTIDEIFDVQFADIEWVVEPTIEADDIYYLADYPDFEHSINELSKQANNSKAVIQRGNELGIIDIDGNLLTEVAYKEIANFGDSYMMIRTIPKYSEEYDMDWEIYWLNKEGEINEDVGNGDLDLTVYYYYNGIRQRTGNLSSDFVQEAIPVQKSSVYHAYDTALVMDNLSGKYALEYDCNLITDFIYDECGSLSDGLVAVCQNGKWGYVNDKGKVVIPIEYDASWQQYPIFDGGSRRSSNDVKEYCYAASDGYVVLCQDGEWELKDTNGNSVIQKGVFEAIRPVFDGKCWVKKAGKWGVIRLVAEADDTQSLDGVEEKNDSIQNYKEVYKPIIQDIYAKSGEYAKYNLYSVYDIDKDGIKELIAQEGTCEADYMYKIYTIKENQAKYLGEISGFHCSFYMDEKGGKEKYIIRSEGHMGNARVSSVKIKNSNIVEEEISSNDNGDYYENPYPLATANLEDMSLLQ